MRALIIVALMFIGLASCDGGASDTVVSCRMASTEVTISGTVSYEGYQAGEIALYISEETSEMCGESDDSMLISDPGDQIGTLVLDAPGTFETTVTVSYVEGNTPPILDISAYHNASQGNGQCEAGGFLSVQFTDSQDVDLVLESGFCPIQI